MSALADALFLPVEVRTRDGRTLPVRVSDLDDFAALVEMYKGFEPKRVAQGVPPPDVPRNGSTACSRSRARSWRWMASA
jgi:hypothetical protein